jgi:hypothetical protein
MSEEKTEKVSLEDLEVQVKKLEFVKGDFAYITVISPKEDFYPTVDFQQSLQRHIMQSLPKGVRAFIMMGRFGLEIEKMTREQLYAMRDSLNDLLADESCPKS